MTESVRISDLTPYDNRASSGLQLSFLKCVGERNIHDHQRWSAGRQNVFSAFHLIQRAGERPMQGPRSSTNAHSHFDICSGCFSEIADAQLNSSLLGVVDTVNTRAADENIRAQFLFGRTAGKRELPFMGAPKFISGKPQGESEGGNGDGSKSRPKFGLLVTQPFYAGDYAALARRAVIVIWAFVVAVAATAYATRDDKQ